MAKLLLKWDLTKGNAKDLSGNGWDGMFYGGIGTVPNEKGIYLGGNSQFIHSSFNLPIDKDYFIIFKIAPTKFLTSETAVRYLVDSGDGGLSVEMRAYDYSTAGAASNILAIDKVNNSWVNNPFEGRENKWSYPSLYDGTEKTVVIYHPGKLGDSIQTIIDGTITCTMPYKTLVPKNNAFQVGASGGSSYKGYISSVAVYEGKYDPTLIIRYAVLRPDTGDVFSFNNNLLTILGKIDELNPDLLQAQGTDLETIRSKLLPRFDVPVKIISIQ